MASSRKSWSAGSRLLIVNVLPAPGASTLLALSVALDRAVYVSFAAGLKLYDQLLRA